MKRNFRSLVAMLLALVMVLAACSPKSGDSKESTGEKSGDNKKPATALKGSITVQAEEPWKAYYEETIKRIQKDNPDAKIELKIAGSFEHLEVIDKTDAKNKDVADVFAIPADRFDGLKQNEVLAALPAQEMAKELGGFKDYDKGLGGAFKVENDYLAFPYNIETLITFVNTKNAEAQGIDHKKALDLAEIKDPANVLLPLSNAWFGVSPNLAGKLEFLAKDGNKFKSTYTQEYAKLTDEQKTVFENMYKYWKLHNEAKTSLFDKDASGGYVDKEFTTGNKGVARLDGPWATSGDSIIAKEIKAGNVEIYPINHLKIAGKEFSHWKGGWALVANSRIEEDKDKMALAVAFIKELVKPERAIDLYKATGKILENAELKQYKDSDLSDTDKKVVENVLKSYEVSTPRPLFKEYGQVWNTWENSVLSWNASKPAKAEDAYNAVKAAFEAMMQQISQQ